MLKIRELERHASDEDQIGTNVDMKKECSFKKQVTNNRNSGRGWGG